MKLHTRAEEMNRVGRKGEDDAGGGGGGEQTEGRGGGAPE